MIKILKYGQVATEEIFARVTPKVDVSAIVTEIIDNVKAKGDAALFELLEKDQPFSPALLCEVVRRCMMVKCRVVENDEHESGERKLLNFGHTLAHALEKHMNYSGISHGCAVAVGMAAITAASERQGLTAAGSTARLVALCKKFGLPTTGPVDVSAYLEAVKLDKKCIGGSVDLVLMREIGDAFCHRVPTATLGAFLGC